MDAQAGESQVVVPKSVVVPFVVDVWCKQERLGDDPAVGDLQTRSWMPGHWTEAFRLSGSLASTCKKESGRQVFLT